MKDDSNYKHMAIVDINSAISYLQMARGELTSEEPKECFESMDRALSELQSAMQNMQSHWHSKSKKRVQ